MRRHIALWIGWCATLAIALAASVLLMFRWFQPPIGLSWQKWAWALCATVTLVWPVRWIMFGLVRRRLALFSIRERIIWIAATLLAGALLVKLIPLSAMPVWHPAQINVAAAGANIEVTPQLENMAIRPLCKSLLLRACDVICLTLPLLVVGLWLATRGHAGQISSRTSASRPSRWAFLAYASPCALVWSYYLWVFWPGLMSYDSFAQWFQFTTGPMTDWHPAFHTMTNWLITRVWASPAAVALAQILALSAVIGWGLARMRQKGMPFWLAVAICLVLALSPADGATVITLWKDVPYAICLLLLGLLTAEVVASQGAWLDRPSAWTILGITAALTALYRHNGPMVAFLSLAVLLIAYRQKWPRLALALSLAVGCWLGVRGPLYWCAGVQPMPASLQLCPVLHHIAAHSNAGTPITPEGQTLMARVHPLVDGKWPYDPTNVGPMFDDTLSTNEIDAHRKELIRLFLSLAWQRPMVELKHVIVNSSMVWQVTHTEGNCLMLACNIVDDKGLRMNPEILNDPKHIIGGPLVEITRPLPPGLAASLSGYWSWLVWRPAFPLYLLLFGAAIAVIRTRQWRFALLAMPAGLQSLSLAMFCPAFDLRYQWGVCLSGVMLGGFALWCAPRRAATRADDAGTGGASGEPRSEVSTPVPRLRADSGEALPISVVDCATSASAPSYDDVAVLVPCYNEELSVAKVVRDFRAALPGAAIYVFDNNSKDQTRREALQAGATVIQSHRQGKGHVVRHMFDAVDANLYVMVDGDDTYPASAAPELVHLARTSGADMVVGTRLEQFQNGSFRRFHCLGNRMIARLLSSIFGVWVTDVLSGYRVFSREFVRSVPVMSPGFEIETELTLHAMAKKFVIREQPVPYGERPQGSFSKLRTYRDGYHILKTIFLIFKDYKPLTFFGAVGILIAVVSLLAGLPAIADYVKSGVVLHLPSAVLAASLAVLSALSTAMGLLLHTLRNYHNENMELFRRVIAQMDRVRRPDVGAAHAAGDCSSDLPGDPCSAASEKEAVVKPPETLRAA